MEPGGGGLVQFDKKSEQFQHYRHDPGNLSGLSDVSVFSIFEDAQGLLWIGTVAGGVNIFDRSTSAFAHLDLKAYIDEILQRHHLEIALDSGTWSIRHQSDQNTAYNIGPALPIILEDSRGFVWIGGYQSGLYQIIPGKSATSPPEFIHYQHAENDLHSLQDPNNVIDTLFEDSQGRLWAGSGGVLHQLVLAENSERLFKVIRYPHDPNDPRVLNGLWINAIIEDSRGTLWVGTNTGLYQLVPADEMRFIRYEHDAANPHSLSANDVSDIFEDTQGTLWIGTVNGGLNRFDRETGQFTHYREQDGLSNDSVLCIVEDDQRNLWLNTLVGIDRFNLHQETFSNYDVHDGVQLDSVQNTSKIPCRKDNDGTITARFNSFHPDNILENSYIPPVVLTDFKLFNQSVPLDENGVLPQPINYTEEIVLDYSDYLFSIEFSALNYRQSDKNQFAYQLEGFDPEWLYTDFQNRRATYTNVPPGTYTFRVKASNDDGLWNETGNSVKITITPPWWQTLWFRGLMLILGIGVLIGGVQWRLYATEQRNRELVVQVKARTTELAESNQSLEIAKEQADEAREKAEIANQAKSTFLASMSHELRTPLNGILGYAQILKRDLSTPPKQQHGLNIIESSGKHLLMLINDVLDLAKVESGTIDLYQTNFHLSLFLNSVGELIHIRAKNKGVEFRLEDNPTETENLPTYLHGDERRLRQVLLNLLGNAVKFTEHGQVRLLVSSLSNTLPPSVPPARGEATPPPSRGRLGGGRDSANLKTPFLEGDSPHSSPLPLGGLVLLRFEVIDTGIGITPEDIQAIFEPFQQVGEMRQRVKGTGLGLAISRNLIRVMGGELHVESTPGQGSRFWFDLPFAEVVATAPAIEEHPQTQTIVGISGEAGTVLIVDDNWENRAVLVDLLTPLGFQTLEAENGREGLAQAAAQSPNLIITDLVMPEMDGFELIQKIRQTSDLQQIPIIAASASVYEQEQQKSLTLGGDAFLQKPIEAEQLFDLLQRLLPLEWVYQESEPESMSQAETTEMVLPSVDMLNQLLNHAEDGDIQAIINTLDELEQEQADLAPFINQFRQLASSFNLNKISVLLEEYLRF
ncbi:ATP-binding protein [Anaerolineales bacterium HSG25]|nr:ATP-binding protein [Anaerolineales bacterium HSG25]